MLRSIERPEGQSECMGKNMGVFSTNLLGLVKGYWLAEKNKHNMPTARTTTDNYRSNLGDQIGTQN